jgi:regulator of RNase E activity RraA
MPAPIAQDVLARLRRISTATLTTQLLKLGFRNTYLRGLQPVDPTLRMAGEAKTLRFAPAREDLATFELTTRPDYPQRQAIEGIRPGEVLVVDCRGVTDAAAGGEIYLTRLKVRRAAGAVIDGAIRDYPAVRSLGFPVYAKGAAAPPHPARHLAVDVDVPIGCAEVLVVPGDILVGDGEGVVCIPRHVAEEVARTGEELEELERFVLEKIRAGAAVPGTYPPDTALRAEYEKWRRTRAGT